MRFNTIFLIIIALILSSCSIEDEPVVNNTSVATWHLIKSENPIIGTLSSFDLDTIIWLFDDTTYTLTVENNNTDDTKYDLLDSGIYNYDEITNANATFIVINESEYGITINENIFTLVHEVDISLSSGEMLDGGLIYTFQRIISVQ